MLIDRLIEIAKREKHCDHPTQQQIADVCGLTRSRISQIKAAREAASLNADAILNLTKKGYSANWVQHGNGLPMAAQPTPAAASYPIPQACIELADLFATLPEAAHAKARLKIRHAIEDIALEFGQAAAPPPKLAKARR